MAGYNNNYNKNKNSNYSKSYNGSKNWKSGGQNRKGAPQSSQNNQQGNDKVVAPYNFAPFSDHVLVRYENTDDLPRHDALVPGLLSGEIHVTMTAETPVCVRGEDNESFYKNADGRYAIPGTTMRGLIRENMQILGLGHVRAEEDLDDDRIMFRELAAARDANTSPDKQYYTRLLDVKTHPKRVDSGYIRKNGNSYAIYQTLDLYYRVARGADNQRRFPLIRELSAPNTPPQEIAVAFRADDQGNILGLQRLEDGVKPPVGMEHGRLLVTGQSVGKKKNAVYIFPEPDEEAVLYLTDDDVRSYRVDFERRMTILGDQSTFWELPKDDGPKSQKAVFFAVDEETDRIYFGRSLFLRIGYPHTIGEGIPSRHRELALDGDAVVLDYPHAVLGYARGNSAYKSRVSFSDLAAAAGIKPIGFQSMVLGGPKPSFTAGYLEGEKTSYVDDHFRLRGYKQYWMKQKPTPKAANSSNMNSKMAPLPAGTRFSGVIRYKNLHPDELGLLLWSLLADGKHCHTVGGGKPYGFGRMSLQIDALKEYDWAALYAPDGLCAVPGRTEGSVEEYIEAYQSFAAQALARETDEPPMRPADREEIRDFLFLKSTITNDPETFRYMELPEYKNNSGVLPAAAQFREEAGGGT